VDSFEQLLRDVKVHFKPSFFGPKNIYVRLTDNGGLSSGWLEGGQWRASDEEPPNPVAVTPYIGAGFRQSFVFSLSDINGRDDIEKAEFLFQANRNQAGACSFVLEPRRSTVALLDDKGTSQAGELTLGANGKIQNAQCAISDPTIVADSGDSRKMRIEVEFARQFSGRRNVYARAEDKAQQSSRWCWLGSWIVP
jgi:hypothetical protein